MKSDSNPTLKTVENEPLHADKMDTGHLHRGDGVLPIVGLGGSAGSIAALQEFFAIMPADSGMAFVVVLHLSPHHESTLAQMLQRSTAMPVVAASDGVTVVPNSVYVIPPGKFLATANGRLRLTEVEEHRGKRVAVDYFFRTLAESRGAQSLAVVLSGAGGDGALGLKRVKELGGLTIAQDPDEAEHADMPRSAIATGVVDWVLGVREMPAKLMAYVRQGVLKILVEDEPHPAKTHDTLPESQEMALKDILTFLHTRTGRDFTYYKRATIIRRIARRLQVNGIDDLPSYLTYLRTHAGEAGALLQDLLISVTNFFRDPLSYAALEKNIPDLFKGKDAGDTVRVWVAGCATGEEAYSIAMLLCEYAERLVGPPQIQIFATDLDEEVIREAREGIYPESIAADVSEERLRHFFIRQNNGYRVRRAVRELVLFALHDLLKDSPFSRLDLVSCRNLLIYLNREAQSRAFEIFYFALRPSGRLFLGSSEAVDEGSPLFAVLDKKERLYIQRPGPPRLVSMPGGPGTLARTLTLHERAKERPLPEALKVGNVQSSSEQTGLFDAGLPPGELHYRLIERLSPPSILVNSAHDIVHLSESAGRFLQFKGGEPTLNLLRTVHPMLRIELRAALYAAAHTHTLATAARVEFKLEDTQSLVDIRVTPAGDLAPDFLLVVFEECPDDGTAEVASPRDLDTDKALLHLERELLETKAHLRATVEESEASTEELKASNEELQAMNEELRSATEELETSREELQSINDELTTVNEALKSNVDQLARSNNDLQNLMAATDIATVFLDRGLNIQRFTPSAKALFNLISSDLGRPLSDLSRHLDYPNLVYDAERSLAQLQPLQREVRAGERWYIARTLPYRTADDRIAGVVLTFLNITEQKRAEEEIARLAAHSERQRRLYETVLTNTPDFVYVFSLDHKVLYANDSLIKMWGRGHDGAIGKTFLEIGYEAWHAEMHDREIDQVRATKQPVRGEVPFTGTSGRRDYEYIFVPVIGADGEVEAVAGTTRDVTDRKEAELAIRAGQERLSLALSAAQMVAWEWTPGDKKLRMSENAADVYGMTAGIEVTGIEQGLALLHPEDVASYQTTFQRAIDERTGYTTRYRIVRPDNSKTIWIEERGHTAFDQPGGGVRLFGVAMDVTDRVQAEEALRQSEERSAFVRQSSGIGFWYCDLPFDVLQWDELAKAHFHLPPDAPVTIQTFYDRLHPDDREPTRQSIQESIDHRRDYNVEYRTVEPETEKVKWVRAIGRTSYAADGTPIRFDGITLDVSDQKRAEANLRESEQRFRLVADAAPVLIWLSGTDHSRYWFNQPWLNFTGRSMEQEIGSGWTQGIHGDDLDRTLETYSVSCDSCAPFSMEYRLRRHDGQFRWMVANCVPRYNLAGEFEGFIGSCIDITDYKNAEAALRDADRRKDEFLATLAHELRNPLAPIRNGLQVMRLSGSDDENTAEVRSMMERQLHQMIRLVDDLLDVSRITRDTLTLKKERVELAAVVSNAIETSRPIIEQADHAITVTLPPAPIYLDADMTRLAQVFSNLLNNSAKYTPAGGRIWLTAKIVDSEIAVTVGDNGSGIPADSLPSIFQMFSQVQRNLDMAQGGLGIGLTLVRRLVEMHGGTVEARSDGPGKGSEFTVRLPVLALTQQTDTIADNGSGLALVNRRILVVDDNQDSAKSLALMLKLMGNEIHTSHDGLAAVADAERIRPDMILLDIGLPKLNGYDACRRIREQSWSCDMVIVALTGWGTEDDRRRAKEAGFNHHLVKPVELAALDQLLSAPKPQSSSLQQPNPPQTSLRVLVVDDRRDATHMLRTLLTRAGYDVQTAADGPSALALAVDFRPEAVLLDINMPGISGLEVAKRIRQQSTLEGIVLIAMTGNGDDEDRQRSLEAGFDFHLVKPADINVVYEILAKVK